MTEERNFGKNKMMLKVEDNGENEYFRTEVEINKEFFDYESDHNSNKINIVPVDKETNLVFLHFYEFADFVYKRKDYTFIIIIIVIAILILIIIIGILFYRKKKKEKGNNIEDEIGNNEGILSDN